MKFNNLRKVTPSCAKAFEDGVKAAWDVLDVNDRLGYDTVDDYLENLPGEFDIVRHSDFIAEVFLNEDLYLTESGKIVLFYEDNDTLVLCKDGDTAFLCG